MTDTGPQEAAGPGQLELRRRGDEHGVVLRLVGELDLASAPALARELRAIEALKPRRVLIDLRELRFMDSTGIALIIQAHDIAHASGHRLTFRRGPDQIQRLLQLTGLLDLLVFED